MQILVKNRVKDGYRRAGLALAKGDNQLDNITDAQLAQLQADARLSVVVSDATPNGGNNQKLPENNQGGDTPQTVVNSVLPANLTVDQIKDKLTALNIQFNNKAVKAELVALLEAAQSAQDAQ